MATPGFGTAALNLGPYVQASTPLNAANTFTIGELSSSDATAQLAGIIYNSTTPGSFTATYIVGGRNTTSIFPRFHHQRDQPERHRHHQDRHRHLDAGG